MVLVDHDEAVGSVGLAMHVDEIDLNTLKRYSIRDKGGAKQNPPNCFLQ